MGRQVLGRIPALLWSPGAYSKGEGRVLQQGLEPWSPSTAENQPLTPTRSAETNETRLSKASPPGAT